MKSKIFTDAELVQELRLWFNDFLEYADADDLARFAGETFGGDCFARLDFPDDGDDASYEFTPNDGYCGQLGSVSEFEEEAQNEK
ncbi:MAG: hypothetical protein WA061_01710 [Microgenomates group bacterium]